MPDLRFSSNARLVAICCLLLLLAVVAPVRASGLNPVVVHKATQPLVIDGKLSDWNTAGGSAHRLIVSPSGTASIGAVGRLAWDEESLFVAVDVSDREISVSDDLSRDFRGSDSVRLYVSIAPPTESRSGRFGEKDFVFVVTPTSLFQRPLKTVYGYGGYEHLGLDLTKLKVATRPTSTAGYALELAIPWRELGIVPKNGLPLGLQLLVIDAGTAKMRAWATLTPIPPESFESPDAMVAGVLAD